MADAQPADLEHLFRREAGRMTSALTRIFGLARLPLVEDVVHDALCRALETWKFSGVPDNPSAWLMAAAKNRAIDVIRRERRARELEPDLASVVSTEWSLVPAARALEAAFGDDALRDETLRMMFACCHPKLPDETQVALILHLLGGFGVREVAAAFLAGDAAMEKRIQRAKKVLASTGHLADVTEARAREHLGAVHGALYLMFNEGYHGAHAVETIRAELCAEAIRLTTLLAEDERTGAPSTHALLALMCLTAARLPGRTNAAAELVPLAEQDRSRWDGRLIERGVAALERSASGDALSVFHLEAAIAYEHTVARDRATTSFSRIADLYELRMRLAPSPVVALNRAIALGEAEGPGRGLAELEAIEGRERLRDYPFYAAARGEQLLRQGREAEARAAFTEAHDAARSDAERAFFTGRVEACSPRRRGLL